MDQLLDVEVAPVRARRAHLHPLGAARAIGDRKRRLHEPKSTFAGACDRASSWSLARAGRYVARVRRLSGLLLVVVVALAAAPAALAHAKLIAVEPANGATLATAPVSVRLFFDEPVAVGPGNAVVAADHRSVLAGAPRLERKDHLLVLPLRPHLPNGDYSVSCACSRTTVTSSRASSPSASVQPLPGPVPRARARGRLDATRCPRRPRPLAPPRRHPGRGRDGPLLPARLARGGAPDGDDDGGRPARRRARRCLARPHRRRRRNALRAGHEGHGDRGARRGPARRPRARTGRNWSHRPSSSRWPCSSPRPSPATRIGPGTDGRSRSRRTSSTSSPPPSGPAASSSSCCC